MDKMMGFWTALEFLNKAQRAKSLNTIFQQKLYFINKLLGSKYIKLLPRLPSSAPLSLLKLEELKPKAVLLTLVLVPLFL